MAHAPTAAVTAKGIRDGDRAALGALVARRGAAVLAYCDRVAAPGRALEAAGEAFARFRREVVAASEPRALDPEALLLSGTRRGAAPRGHVCPGRRVAGGPGGRSHRRGPDAPRPPPRALRGLPRGGDALHRGRARLPRRARPPPSRPGRRRTARRAAHGG